MKLNFGLTLNEFMFSQLFITNSKLQKAEDSLKFYKGFTGNSIDEHIAFNAEFHRLKSIANEQKADEKTPLRHICK